MIDFGLLALVVLMMIMVAACGYVFMGIKAEIRGIAAMEARITEVTRMATDAAEAVKGIEVGQYKRLDKRFDELAEDLRAQGRKLQALDDQVLRAHANIGAIKRWRKAEPTPEPEGEAQPMTLTPPAEETPANVRKFGRKAV